VDKHALGSRRLPEDGHLGRVAAEFVDVLLDPLQGRLLVHNSIIARGIVRRLVIQLGVGKEPEGTEPVVRRDNDDSFLCKGGPVIRWHVEGNLLEPPAKEKDHDR
jgi:hypothetical protein